MTMYEMTLVDRIPIGLLYLLCVALVMLSVHGGALIARARARRYGADSEGPIGSVVGASMGLLAFILAFTFGIAASRRESKRDLLLDEVNAIGTTYLRASLIPEPHRGDARKLLRRYVDIRVELAGNPGKLDASIREAKEIQDRLWAHATALADADLRNPDIVSLFIDSLNEMIDLQTKRVVVGFYRIPEVIWVVLGALTILSMAAVGYQFGASGKSNLVVNTGLALAFSLVILLIADLDRVTSGWLRVSNAPMIALQAEMADASKGAAADPVTTGSVP